MTMRTRNVVAFFVRHKFNPGQNGTDPATTFDIRREITLAFSATDPDHSPAPEFGDSIMGGTYSKPLTRVAGVLGLHKQNIYTEGTFRLQRVSLVNVLNQ